MMTDNTAVLAGQHLSAVVSVFHGGSTLLQPLTSLLGSSSQFLLFWYLTGARDSPHFAVLPSPPATQHLPTASL